MKELKMFKKILITAILVLGLTSTVLAEDHRGRHYQSHYVFTPRYCEPRIYYCEPTRYVVKETIIVNSYSTTEQYTVTRVIAEPCTETRVVYVIPPSRPVYCEPRHNELFINFGFRLGR